MIVGFIIIVLAIPVAVFYATGAIARRLIPDPPVLSPGN